MKSTLHQIVRRVANRYPHLKRDLRMAHISLTPAQFISKNFRSSLPLSLGLTILAFFVVDKAGLPYALLPLFFIAAFFLTFNFSFLSLKGKIARRRIEIDREVLFAGQFLLIKLHSGKPLLNALMDTTKSYGVASHYIKEIVDDIDTGSSLEVALDNAIKYAPSDKLRKIFFQVNNALRLGIDVTGPLRTVLDEITKEQEVEIKRYGKKLNSIVIFYMLAAIVIPSIGMTVFIVLSSFISLSLSVTHFMVMGFFLILIELIFLSVFRSIRPTVNI